MIITVCKNKIKFGSNSGIVFVESSNINAYFVNLTKLQYYKL